MSLLLPSATDKILEVINLCDQRVLNTEETVKYHIYIDPISFLVLAAMLCSLSCLNIYRKSPIYDTHIQ